MSLQVRQDLAHELLGDLGQAVILTRMAGDLLQDVVLGLAGEGGGAAGHHRSTCKGLHRSDLPVGYAVLALCDGAVTLTGLPAGFRHAAMRGALRTLSGEGCPPNADRDTHF